MAPEKIVGVKSSTKLVPKMSCIFRTTSSVDALCFMPNQRELFIGTGGGQMVLVDILTKEKKRAYQGHNGFVSGIFVNQGYVYTSCLDGAVRMFSHKSSSIVSVKRDFQSCATCLEFSSGVLYVGSWDQTVIAWNLRTWESSVFKKYDSSVLTLTCFGPILLAGLKSGHIVSASSMHRRRDVVACFKGHKDYVTKIMVRQPLMVSVSKDSTLRIWDLNRARERERYLLMDLAGFFALQELKNTQNCFLAGTGSGELLMFQLMPENLNIPSRSVLQEITRWKPHSKTIFSIAQTDVKILSASGDHTVVQSEYRNKCENFSTEGCSSTFLYTENDKKKAHEIICVHRMAKCPDCLLAMKFITIAKHRKTDCLGKKISCGYCKLKMFKSVLEAHMLKEHTKIQCKRCNLSILEKNLEKHEERCPDVGIRCTNQHCDAILLRKYLNRHLHDECSFRHLPCYICQSSFIRKNLMSVDRLSIHNPSSEVVPCYLRSKRRRKEKINITERIITDAMKKLRRSFGKSRSIDAELSCGKQAWFSPNNAVEKLNKALRRSRHSLGILNLGCTKKGLPELRKRFKGSKLCDKEVDKKQPKAEYNFLSINVKPKKSDIARVPTKLQICNNLDRLMEPRAVVAETCTEKLCCLDCQKKLAKAIMKKKRAKSTLKRSKSVPLWKYW